MVKIYNSSRLEFLRGSIFNVIVWPLICIVLIVLVWYITLVKIDTDRVAIEKNALNESLSFSHAYTSYLSQRLEAIEQIILQIMLTREHSHETSVLEELRQSGVFRNAHITQVSIINRDGIIAKNLFIRNEKSASVADQNYFHFHKNDESNILLMGKPTIEQLSGKSVLTFTRRLNMANGSFDGLVLISVEASYLTSFYAGSNPGKTGLIAVVGADGSVRSARIGEKTTSTLPAIIPLFDTQEGADLLQGEKWFGDDLPRFVAWETLKRFPLIAMVGISEQEFLAPHRQTWGTYRQVAFAGSFLLFIFAIVATAMSVRLVRKKYQAEEVSKTYRIATEGGNEGFYMYHLINDNNGNIVDFELVDCNKRGADFYGINKIELLGKKLSSLYPAPYFNTMINLFCNIMESGFYENEEKIPKGNPLKLEWAKIRLVRSAAGLAVTVQNISERKKNEEALRESEKKLRLIHSQVPGIVYQFKIDINGKKFLPYVSPSIENYIGLTAKTVMDDAEKWFDLTHPDDYPGLEKSILESLNNLSIWNWEGRFVRKGGKTVWLRGTSTPERDEDGSTIWNGLFIDVTKRRLQEEQIRRTQKMDALGKLTGGIAHDYNNILGIVLGYAEQINENLNDTDKIKNYSQSIMHSAKRGAKLTKKLLAFSRHQQPNAIVININSLLQEQQQLLEKTLTPIHKLSLEMEDNLWQVEVNISDLEDAIINMCINAMHAMKTGGKLTIKTSNEILNAIDAKQIGLSSGEYVLLSITDTGSGMDDITKENIFDPFYTTKGERGTGLGLSQVYGFIQSSNGAINVYSEIGHGSRFVLYFPRSSKSITKTESTPLDNVQKLGGNETLLVVDDEQALTTLAYDILTAQGYHVITASDGEKALALLKSEKVDLIISDVIMPNMDGYQLAAQVQQLYPNIKLQLVSGFADERNNLNVDDYLRINMIHKPYTSNTLLMSVRNLLNEGDTSDLLTNRTILILDDDENIQILYKIKLQKLGCHVIAVYNGMEAIEIYKTALETDKPIDVMIVDLSIPDGMGGKEVTDEIRKIHHHAKVIVASGNSEAPEMIKPQDYGFDSALDKNFNLEKIKYALKQVLMLSKVD